MVRVKVWGGGNLGVVEVKGWESRGWWGQGGSRDGRDLGSGW